MRCLYSMLLSRGFCINNVFLNFCVAPGNKQGKAVADSRMRFLKVPLISFLNQLLSRTSLTFLINDLIENGFCMKLIPDSNTP